MPYWVHLSAVRENHQNILKDTPNRIPNTGYADPSIPFVIKKTNDTYDAVHYDAKGQRELGIRYYNAFKNLSN